MIVGGASGGVSIFDINQRKVCCQQKDNEYTSNETTKIFSSKNRVWVLNADQQLTEYELFASPKGGPKLKFIA